MPRMAGRILGALLVAEPPDRSAEQLATTLHASRSSISSMTRLLERAGLIERVGRPGDRRLYYRNRPDAWHQRTLAGMGAVRHMRALAGRGLRLMADSPPDVRQGLVDMYQFYAYWEHEMPRMIARWEEAKERGELPELLAELRP